jgi:ribosomal protein L37AE/L43A
LYSPPDEAYRAETGATRSREQRDNTEHRREMMALDTKQNQTCPQCGRAPVTIYLSREKWLCGKCLQKTAKRPRR